MAEPALPVKAAGKDLIISRKFPRSPKQHMKSKFTGIVVATVFALAVSALAQNGDAAAALPAAPSAAASSPASTPAVTTSTGTKVGTINLEQAIFASNEGQKEFEALSKKLEPKQNELKAQNDELESLKKQLNTQGEKLNDESRGTLVKQIETKQKSLDRSVQDAREDAQNQQNEIAQKILQKMAPIVVKYANDNGFGVIIDTSNPWPNGPVLWAGPSVDITKPIVDAYNIQSGVPAPARPAAARPALPGTKPATPATKPASTAPPASKPQGTQPPK
jgi:outer membrane protein